MFIAWFEANKMYEEGKNLTYAKFPTRFVYIKQKRRWKLEAKKTKFCSWKTFLYSINFKRIILYVTFMDNLERMH